MYAFFLNLINSLLRGIANVINSILNILPTSPFTETNTINTIDNIYLRWIATIVDVKGIMEITIAFTSILAMYYLYQIVMRYAKVIK